MEESKEFLSEIFEMLRHGDVFRTDSNDPKSIVDFKYPDELKVSAFCLDLI